MKHSSLLKIFCLGLLLQSAPLTVSEAAFPWAVPEQYYEDGPNPNPVTLIELVSMLPRIGVIGDGISDEYATYPYGFTSLNWVELLERTSLGQFGSFRYVGNYPRLYSYTNNWSQTDATTADAFAEGQVTGLMTQVQNKWVEAAVIMIGANDFVAVYDSIYDGVWSEAQIDTFVVELTTRMQEIIDSVASVEPNVMVVCTIPDIGDTPSYRFGNRMDDQRRGAVTAVLNRVNDAIREMAEDKDAALFDICAMLKEIVASPEYRYHGYRIDTTSGGVSNRRLFTIDDFHFGTLLQAHIANSMLTIIEDKRIEKIQRVTTVPEGTPLEPEYRLIPPTTIFNLVGIEPSADIFFPNSWYTDSSHAVIESPWFGVLASNNYPWINHAQHGWMYCDGYGGETVRMWDSNLGWLRTNTANYPWFVRELDGHFLRYELGTSQPRRFYDKTAEQWLNIASGMYPGQ